MKNLDYFKWLTFGLFGFIFWHLASQILQIRADGWYVGHVNLYGDLLLHLAFINKFLVTGKFIVENPILSGTKPDYPIFADYLTAQIAKFLPLTYSLFITTFLVGLLVIFSARLFILNFIKNERVVFISLLLFFANGGLGFYYFFQDFFKSGQLPLDFILNLPREYTNIKDLGYWWINSLLAYFLPQRGFLFAFPITLIILLLLYTGTKKSKVIYFVLAGILSGVMPLVQAHSLFLIFLVSAVVLPYLVLNSKKQVKLISHWLIFAVITTAIALPLFNSISSGQSLLQFIKFAPGWTSQENLLWFWFKNLGLFAPMLIIALAWLYKRSRFLFLIYLPFLLIFVISNIFIFQPWNFDNSKLLIYWYFASTIVVAYFLESQFFLEGGLRKITGIILLFIMIFAGSLDLFRTFTKVTFYQIFNNKDIQAAEAVKNLTPINTDFVTAQNHNNPIPSLTGRSTFLGFEGWVWSHGLNYQTRANDIVKIYLGGKDAEELIRKFHLSYITIGPQERASFNINENYFNKYPKIYLTEGWFLYDVRSLLRN